MSAKDQLLKVWYETPSSRLRKDLYFELLKDLPHGTDAGGVAVITWGTPGTEGAVAANTIDTDLQVTDAGGTAWAETVIIRLTCTAPGTMTKSAKVGTVGTVISGSGTNDMLIQTDATGKFSLALLDTTGALAGDIYVMAGPTQGSPAMDARTVLTNTFA